MYKNLCPETLGVIGRQSELIELALTYGFHGLDIDFMQFSKQAELRGLEHAARFLKSAQLKIGAFDLPVRWDGDEDNFKQDLDRLPKLLESASVIGGKDWYTTVMPASDTRPYHENFEFHRERITQIAEVLATHDARLVLTILAPAAHREGRQFQFISSPAALLTLMKTTVVSNLAVMVDLWHWRVGGGTVEQLRELTPEQIMMIRVADLPAGVSMETVTEESRLMPGATGEIDIVGALQVLGELGFDGPVTPYPDSAQLKGQTRDRIVQSACDALDKLWKAARLDNSSKLSAVAG